MKHLSKSDNIDEKNEELGVIFITDEPTVTFSMTPQLEKDLAKARKILFKNRKNSSVELKKMIEKYPHVTNFYNFVILAYQLQERFEEEYEFIKETIKKFPDYFFAKINLMVYYITTENIAQLDKLFKNVDSITDFEPTRKVFHISEVSGFYLSYLSYLAYKLETKKIEKIVLFLESIAQKYEDLEDKMPLIKSKYSEILELTKTKEIQKYIDSILKIEAISTSSIMPVLNDQPFVFNHEEVRKLCSEFFSEMTQEKIDSVMCLPRETFIEDLEGILIDIQTRKQSFYDSFRNETEIPFYAIYHVLSFISVLEVKESVPPILDLFRQDEEFLNFWFTDYLEPSYIVWLLYKFFENDFSSIADFVKEENNEYRVRNGMMSIPAQVAIHHPQRRQEVIAFYKKLIRFFIENKDNKKVIDHAVTTHLGTLVNTIEGKELLQDLIELKEAGLINNFIDGIEDTLEELDVPYYSIFQSEIVNINLSLLEVYRLIENQDKFIYLETEEEQEKRREKSKSIFENSPNESSLFSNQNIMNSLLELENDPYQDDDDDDDYDDFLFNSLLKSKVTYQRNEKVTVRYTNGKIIENTKYKKVEKDVKEGKCEVIQ